jgi:hypothetical protein
MIFVGCIQRSSFGCMIVCLNCCVITGGGYDFNTISGLAEKSIINSGLSPFRFLLIQVYPHSGSFLVFLISFESALGIVNYGQLPESV